MVQMGSLGGWSGTFQLAQGSIFVRLPNRLRRKLTEVSVQSGQFFCLTIEWLKTEILDIFEKSLTHFELLGPQNWSKKFEKNRKNDEIFFFIFVCIMFCLLYYVPQTWYNTRKVLFTSLNNQ